MVSVEKKPTKTSPSKHYTEFNVELFAELNEEFRENPMKKLAEARPPNTNIEEHREFENKYASDKIEMLAHMFGWEKNPPRRILEFGCGSGFIANAIKKTYPDAEVVCTEIYPNKNWVKFPEVEFHVIDISKEDYDTLGTFDYIVSFVVFEHVRHPYGALSALHDLLVPGGRMFFSACLHRGWSASHRYREVFFPWPHLLFPDSVFAEYYEKYLDRNPSAGNIPSWVNGMTPSHYRGFFRKIGFEIGYMRLTGGRAKEWDDQIESFYQRFIDKLGMYPKEDLQSAMMQVALTKPEKKSNYSVFEHRGESRIEWSPVNGATSYRVICWNDTTNSQLGTYVVKEPMLDFDWDGVEKGNYLRYRIQHRIGEEGDWEKTTQYHPICSPPAVILSKSELTRGEQVITWIPVDGAESYRLLIRNDSAGKITDTIVTTECQFLIDWDSRSTKPQRYRVQHRISKGGEWLDGREYAPLLAPPLKSREKTVSGNWLKRSHWKIPGRK